MKHLTKYLTGAKVAAFVAVAGALTLALAATPQARPLEARLMGAQAAPTPPVVLPTPALPTEVAPQTDVPIAPAVTVPQGLPPAIPVVNVPAFDKAPYDAAQGLPSGHAPIQNCQSGCQRSDGSTMSSTGAMSLPPQPGHTPTAVNPTPAATPPPPCATGCPK